MSIKPIIRDYKDFSFRIGQSPTERGKFVIDYLDKRNNELKQTVCDSKASILAAINLIQQAHGLRTYSMPEKKKEKAPTPGYGVAPSQHEYGKVPGKKDESNTSETFVSSKDNAPTTSEAPSPNTQEVHTYARSPAASTNASINESDQNAAQAGDTPSTTTGSSVSHYDALPKKPASEPDSVIANEETPIPASTSSAPSSTTSASGSEYDELSKSRDDSKNTSSSTGSIYKTLNTESPTGSESQYQTPPELSTNQYGDVPNKPVPSNQYGPATPATDSQYGPVSDAKVEFENYKEYENVPSRIDSAKKDLAGKDPGESVTYPGTTGIIVTYVSKDNRLETVPFTYTGKPTDDKPSKRNPNDYVTKQNGEEISYPKFIEETVKAQANSSPRPSGG